MICVLTGVTPTVAMVTIRAASKYSTPGNQSALLEIGHSSMTFFQRNGLAILCTHPLDEIARPHAKSGWL